MDKKNLKRPELREVVITIRTHKSYAKFMKKHEISPSRLFNESLKELIEKK